MLLTNPKTSITLLVPVDSAFNASINAQPLRDESTLDQLVLDAPEIQNPLVGYHGESSAEEWQGHLAPCPTAPISGAQGL